MTDSIVPLFISRYALSSVKKIFAEGPAYQPQGVSPGSQGTAGQKPRITPCG